MNGHRHEHLHLFADGLRRFVHVHEYPRTENEGARPHSHENGRHSHPHGHDLYKPLPANVHRRPIVAAVQ